MSQLELPLPPTKTDLPLVTPITYCYACKKVVPYYEAFQSHTHDFCSLYCLREGSK